MVALRICIAANLMYPSQPRLRRMAEALVDHGHSVDILCLRAPGQQPEEVYNGVSVVRLPVPHYQGGRGAAYLREYVTFFTRVSAELWRRHRRKPYDLVQTPNPPDALVFSSLPLKLRGVPLILDLRELTPELFISRFGLGANSGFVRLLRLQERLSCAYADSVLILHERHRRIMAGRGVRNDKMTQVMNCPDERLFDPARVPPRRAPDGRFVVVHNGGIFRRYGIDLLVESVARVRDEIPGIELHLYGTGDFEQEVRRQAADLGLAGVVHFHGHQPLETMPAAIAAADVGVVPMRRDVFTDCVLSTKLLEYVALGVPAISSRTLTNADYFDDSMVAFFDSDDASALAQRLLETYRDPQASQARAARARTFTEQNNWRTESERHRLLIEQLVQRRKKSKQ